jgi:hypothetical protein
VTDQRPQKADDFIDGRTAGLGRVHRWHLGWVEHINIQVDPESPQFCRRDPGERRCRGVGEAARNESGVGQIQNSRRRKSRVTVRRLRRIAATEQSDVFAPDEWLGTAESSQRSLSATHGETEAHAGHRTRSRFFWRRKIGVAIHINKAYRPPDRPLGTQKAAEHDAAVAAEKHDEASMLGGRRDALAERCAIRGDLALVPSMTGRTYVVSIRRRYDVAEVDGAQALDHVELSKNVGCLVKMSGLAGVIGPDADAGRGSDDRNRPVHV